MNLPKSLDPHHLLYNLDLPSDITLGEFLVWCAKHPRFNSLRSRLRPGRSLRLRLYYHGEDEPDDGDRTKLPGDYWHEVPLDTPLHDVQHVAANWELTIVIDDGEGGVMARIPELVS